MDVHDDKMLDSRNSPENHGNSISSSLHVGRRFTSEFLETQPPSVFVRMRCAERNASQHPTRGKETPYACFRQVPDGETIILSMLRYADTTYNQLERFAQGRTREAAMKGRV